MTSRSVAGLIVLAACGGSQPAPVDVPPSVAAAPAVLAPGADDVLRLPLGTTPPAPWLVPAWPSDLPRTTLDHEITAIGERHAIASGNGRWILVDVDQGILGRIPVPEGTVHVGLGEHDALIVIRTDGTLLRAADLEAARAGRFAFLATLPETPMRWDIAGDHLIAARDASVWIANDGGRHFTAARLPVRGMVSDVVARPDGLFAVRVEPDQGTPAVMVSRDRGRSWRTTAWAPESLHRAGAWIFDDHAACPGVLSREGDWVMVGETPPARPGQMDEDIEVTWLIDDVAEELDRVESWPIAELGTEVELADWAPTTITRPPLPASRGLRHLGAEPMCFDDLSLYGDMIGTDCDGHCLSHEAPPTTAFEVGLLDDGVCATDPAGDCLDDRVPIRAPHLAILDHGHDELQVRAVPDGCVPVKLTSAGAVGVLACRRAAQPASQGAMSLRLVAPDGTVSDQVETPELEDSMRAVEIAADGTVLVSNECVPARPCVAYVRRPTPLGQYAWRRVVAPHAVGFKAAPGGAVLIIALDDTDPGALSLVWDDGAASRRLVGGVKPADAWITVTLRGDQVVIDKKLVHTDGTLR